MDRVWRLAKVPRPRVLPISIQGFSTSETKLFSITTRSQEYSENFCGDSTVWSYYDLLLNTINCPVSCSDYPLPGGSLMALIFTQVGLTLDCGKSAIFIKARRADYSPPKRTVAACPQTASTGSETRCRLAFYINSDAKTHQKYFWIGLAAA